MMGVMARWLGYSALLGSVTGAAYGIFLASTLGSPTETDIVRGAAPSTLLLVGLSLGGLVGVLYGLLVGALLGVAITIANRRMAATTDDRYLRRVRVLSVVVPVALGLVVLGVAGRIDSFDLVVVIAAGVVWGLAGPWIARRHESAWPTDPGSIR